MGFTTPNLPHRLQGVRIAGVPGFGERLDDGEECWSWRAEAKNEGKITHLPTVMVLGGGCDGYISTIVVLAGGNHTTLFRRSELRERILTRQKWRL